MLEDVTFMLNKVLKFDVDIAPLFIGKVRQVWYSPSPPPPPPANDRWLQTAEGIYEVENGILFSIIKLFLEINGSP